MSTGAKTKTDDRGVIQIVEAIIDDTRDLVGAHVEVLREDMTSRLSNLGSTLASSLVAFSMVIVTALLLGIAVATTLIAAGLPVWASFWIVTLVAAVIGFAFVRVAQNKARHTGMAAIDAATRVKEDVTWISTESQTQLAETAS